MTTREYMASKLHDFRDKCGMSVDEVGVAIGKSGKTISAWEVGRGQPDADKLVELCVLYGVRIQDFYQPVASGLADDEMQLLSMYRRLSDTDKQVVTRVVTALESAQ